VNGIAFTDDGLHMVSTGSDHRMRLWDIVEGRNTLVNYPETLNSNRKAQAFARMLCFYY
jgi:DNA excision repair protein ERCC-8